MLYPNNYVRGAQTSTKEYMDEYLTGLGYNVESFEYSPGEIAVNAHMNDFHVDFYYYIHGGLWGEIFAVVVKEDYSGCYLKYKENGEAVGGFAKAQKVAKIISEYSNGLITIDEAQKTLDELL